MEAITLTPSAEITLSPSPTGDGSRVVVGGVDITNAVSGVTVIAHVGCLTEAIIHVPMTYLTATGVKGTFADDLCAGLIALGWTPSAE